MFTLGHTGITETDTMKHMDIFLNPLLAKTIEILNTPIALVLLLFLCDNTWCKPTTKKIAHKQNLK